TEGPPQLAHAIHAEVGSMDSGDLALQFLVPDRAGREWPGLRGVIARWGDCQDLADRLDPEGGPVGLDVSGHFCERRSNSAPKKAAALLRISLARRSSRFSRSSSRIRARSSVVRPARVPRA